MPVVSSFLLFLERVVDKKARATPFAEYPIALCTLGSAGVGFSSGSRGVLEWRYNMTDWISPSIKNFIFTRDLIEASLRQYLVGVATLPKDTIAANVETEGHL
jgi:hypothetical protein